VFPGSRGEQQKGAASIEVGPVSLRETITNLMNGAGSAPSAHGE
jgi:hypothetical protein